ncbi:MAG: D-alanyl-D-alanine carboxypeptidase, partial [Candidatus Parcubacteria bacterium]|nr:D-alanyl-D-alanine carboxypeptidase [Candidatus Parcubacteria bacterium]
LAGDGTPGSKCLIARNPTAITSGQLTLATGPVTGDTAGGGGGQVAGGSRCTVIPDSQLKVIPGTGGMKLITAAADNFIRMRADAARAGVTIALDSAYRTPQRGEEIWVEHRCRVGNGCRGAVCAVNGPAAVPCSLGCGSNHQTGVAIDVTYSGRAVEWVTANGGPYGFVHDPNWNADLHHFSQTGR